MLKCTWTWTLKHRHAKVNVLWLFYLCGYMKSSAPKPEYSRSYGPNVTTQTSACWDWSIGINCSCSLSDAFIFNNCIAWVLLSWYHYLSAVTSQSNSSHRTDYCMFFLRCVSYLKPTSECLRTTWAFWILRPNFESTVLYHPSDMQQYISLWDGAFSNSFLS